MAPEQSWFRGRLPPDCALLVAVPAAGGAGGLKWRKKLKCSFCQATWKGVKLLRNCQKAFSDQRGGGGLRQQQSASETRGKSGVWGWGTFCPGHFCWKWLARGKGVPATSATGSTKPAQGGPFCSGKDSCVFHPALFGSTFQLSVELFSGGMVKGSSRKIFCHFLLSLATDFEMRHQG
jgi:hypothetical protein